MNKVPRISDAEWEVMNVVWGKHPVTANEVVQELAERTTWNHRTIRTMLNRLVKKGALSYEAKGKAYLYEPRIRKELCVRQEGQSFVERVFGGAIAPMLVHFVRNSHLSPREIEELKRIISDKGAS